MTAPLAGLDVIELAWGPATGLAAMILSDFGARVIQHHNPASESTLRPAAARMWSRGRSTQASTTTTPLHELVTHADVVIAAKDQPIAGGDYESLARINPQLIYLEISAAGDVADLPLNEGLVAARFGRMQTMAGILKSCEPTFAAVQVATHATSQNIVTGILAALYERNRSGLGQKIETSLLEGLKPYDMGLSMGMQFRQQTGTQPPAIDPSSIMPTLNYQPVQCSDGKWLAMGNLLPHLFASFLKVIGLEAEAGNSDIEALRDKILQRLQTKTSDEWMLLFEQDGGIAAHRFQTAEQALLDPDMTMNGHAIEIDDVLQLGPVAELTQTPAKLGITDKSAPRWQLPDHVFSTGNQLPPRTAPLQGVKVVELSTIIAAPLGASFLADLGARVIKVESPGGDPFRNMADGFGSLRCNQGKESIGLDLKKHLARDMVQRIIANADIVIHNFRPGVPERLGIDYQTLSKLNPGLIYLSANGYGRHGPGALRPSTHPIPGAAMGGAGYQAGGLPEELLDLPALREAGRRIMRANEVNPDPNTAMVIATSAMLGLIARERTGKGQEIFGDMFIANAYANFDDMVSFIGKVERPALSADLKGALPLQRLYACEQRGEERDWIFLSIDKTRDWVALCRVLARTDLSDRYPAPFTLDEQSTLALTQELQQLFESHSKDHWSDLSAHIVCLDGSTLAQFFHSQCRPDSSIMVQVEHHNQGPYYRHRAMLRFSRSALHEKGCVAGGQNSRSILAEFGFDEAAIASGFSSGAVWGQ